MTRYLSGKFFSLLSVVLLVGASATAVPVLHAVYIPALIALAFVTYLDRRTLPKAGDMAISFDVPPAIELHKTGAILVDVALPNGYDEPGRHFVSLERLELLQRVSRRSELLADPNSRSRRARVEVRGARLGIETIAEVALESTSAKGLWYGRLPLRGSEHQVRVVPPLERPADVTLEQLLSRQRLLLTGARVRLRSSTPDQYYTSRLYRYPDSLRFVDWKKTAKSGKMHTKVFDDLHRSHLIVVFDLGRAMVGMMNGSRKADYYISATRALVSEACAARDSVSLIALADGLVFKVKSVSGPDDAERLLTGARAAPREAATDFSTLLSELSSLSSQRSIVTILTDTAFPSVQSELTPVMSRLAQKHQVVALSMVDSSYHLPTVVASTDTESLTWDGYLDLVYLYKLDESAAAFRAQVDGVGAAAVAVPERYWMDVSAQVYRRLRMSLRN